MGNVQQLVPTGGPPIYALQTPKRAACLHTNSQYVHRQLDVEKKEWLIHPIQNMNRLVHSRELALGLWLSEEGRGRTLDLFPDCSAVQRIVNTGWARDYMYI